MAKIRGRLVSEETGEPLAHLLVEAWDVGDQRGHEPLARAESNADGVFLLVFETKADQAYFRVLLDEEVLLDTRQTERWHPQRREPVVLTVPRRRKPDDGDGDGEKPVDHGVGVVEGIVADELGVAAEGLQVEVYDHHVGGRTLLGTAITEASGSFTLEYPLEALEGKPGADLQIRVLDPRRDRTEVATSPVIYRAAPRVAHDVVIDAASVRRRPEFERLHESIAPLTGNIPLERLDADDVTYLAERSGWDARAVAMAARAAQLSSDTGIPPEHYYAILRAGVPGQAEQLHRLSGDQLQKTIEAATGSGIIGDGASVADTIAIHREQSFKALIELRAPGAVSTLGEMLSLRLDEREQSRFLEIYGEMREEPAALWDRLDEAGFADETIVQLRGAAALGRLTLQNAAVVGRLLDSTEVSSLDDLAAAGFHRPERWANVIGDDVPEGLTPESYAAGLAAQVAINAPTLVAADLVRSRELEVAAGDQVADFLAAAHGTHTLGAEPVSRWAGFGDLAEDARTDVLRVERLYQMSPSNEAMVTLANLGLGSARDIASYPHDAFMEKFGGEFRSAAEADLVHRKATDVHATAMNVATMYIAARTSPNVYSVSGSKLKQIPMLDPDVVATGTLEDLFDEMDYCSCDHCKSVFGPAAYLVELLEFLDVSDLPHEKSNPLDVLLGRRPDLEHIALSCENTNVVLPYVDIVNDVLEYYVVHGGSLTGFAGHDMTPASNSADLLADPEFVEESAYVATAAAVYPASLPFDKPLAELRLLHEQWGTTLADALAAFGDPAGARRERLGLNGAEYRILTDNAFHALPEYFGEAADASIGELNDAIANAKVFSRRVDVSYMELVELLRARFVNPAEEVRPLLEQMRVPLPRIQDWFDRTLDDAGLLALLPDDLDTRPYGGSVIEWLAGNARLIKTLIVLTDLGRKPADCDFSQLELRFAIGDGTEAELDQMAYLRLHRFIRLWRKLGYTVEETDALIMTFLGTASAASLQLDTVDAAWTGMLARVANFRRLLEEMDVPGKRMREWLALFDGSVAAQTRLEQLAALLRIAAEDAADLVEITGLDPIGGDIGADDPVILRFVRTWSALKASPLGIADVGYLLRHDDAAGTLAPPDEQLLRELKSLRDGLTAVEADLGLAAKTPDLGAAKAKMALVYDAPVVDRLFGLIDHTTTYATPFASVEEALPAAVAAAAPNLELDSFSRSLTHAGPMPATTLAAVEAAADALTLADVTAITVQADLDAFVADLKAAAQAVRAAAAADVEAFAVDHPELAAVFATVDALTDPPAKAAALLAGILPELRAGMKARALRTVLAAVTKAEPQIVETITSGAGVLHADADAAAGVLEDFLGLETPVALAADATHALLLDAPVAGDYALYVSAPQGTHVRLVLDGTEVLPDTAVDATGTIRTAAPVALEAGRLHALDVTLGSLPAGASARLRWRTKATAVEDVPGARLYDRAAAARARRSLLRLHKAVLLQRALGFTAAELRHLAADETATTGFLDGLASDAAVTPAAVQAQWQRLERLIWLAQLKSTREPEPEALLAVLQDPTRTTSQGRLVAARVLEWDEASLTAVLAHHSLALTDLRDLDDFRRVIGTLDFVTATGHPAADLRAWTSAAPGAPLVSALKGTLRGRMEPEAYRAAIQPASDALRNLRRDALIALILFHHPPEPAIETPNQLYEYFLMDVQMDACMHTSRIRHALSTVQQFVNRCLMNLEDNVAASSIRADHWKWMQRYRVWEANRKVFVYPENWLEPELRDGKSPFFRELEAELLKSDITEELAEVAYLEYLKKLDDVAKLEIVAAYLHEQEAGNPDDDVLHVFGRTNGKTRQYYTRRFEYGYWTPWEKMAVNVEGDLLVPVVWRSQLFVFWLTLMAKGESGDREQTPSAMAGRSWGSNALVTTEMTLSWAEHYRGKWTSPKSTEMTEPLRITTRGPLDTSRLVLTAAVDRPHPESREQLVFRLLSLNDGGLDAFAVTFTSKHSAPVIKDEGLVGLMDEIKVFNYQMFWEGHGDARLDGNSLRHHDRTFEVKVKQPEGASSSSKEQLLITKASSLPSGFRVRPVLNKVENQWQAPFFYSDQTVNLLMRGREILWDRQWYDTFYDLGAVLDVEDVRIPELYEEPVIPDLGDPVINPWEKVVNQNFKTIITDNVEFAFEGATFNAKGRVEGAVR